MRRLTSSAIRYVAFFLFAMFFLAQSGCTRTVEIEVTKDGCVTVTGIPAGVTQITVTLTGPDEGWTKTGPVTNGSWGPHCFPRGFVGLQLNPGSMRIDTIDSSDNEKKYRNKESVRLSTGDQDVPFDKFEEF